MNIFFILAVRGKEERKKLSHNGRGKNVIEFALRPPVGGKNKKNTEISQAREHAESNLNF